MSRRSLFSGLLLLSLVLAAWLGSRAGWFGASCKGCRNVLLISIDSLRRDRLGLYGHRPEFAPPGTEVSPNLDALGREGVVFDAAWSTSSWTLPAHMALLTGLSDRSHGVEIDYLALDPKRRTLTQELDQAGYRTAGFYSGPYLDPRYGFARGFDRYESGMMSPEEKEKEFQRANRERLARGLPPLDRARFLDALSHQEETSRKVTSLGLEFLEEAAGEPFFLFLHYFDVHYDYSPETYDPELARLFDPDYAGGLSSRNWYGNPEVRDPRTGERRIGERDLAHALAMYDAEIHWVDRHVGRILERLEELGLAEDTVVCVVSDHGDEFFEHGSIGHRSTLYVENTAIPLILRLPGEGTLAGTRVPASVRIYDVAPTLLDYSGSGAVLQEAEGVSLRPWIEGMETRDLPVLQRMMGTLRPMLDGFRQGPWFVVRRFQASPSGQGIDARSSGRVEVLDRSRDPAELQPLALSDPRREEALEAFCRAFEAGEAHAASLPLSSWDLRLSPARTREEEAMLGHLGYAESQEVERSQGLPILPLPSPCPEDRGER